MRVIFAAATAAILFSATAFAQAQTACAPLKVINHIQLSRLAGSNRDLVPVSINGAAKNFLLDTGGSKTMITRSAAGELKLSVYQGNYQMFDMRGNISRDEVTIKDFKFGVMIDDNARLPVIPDDQVANYFDGVLSLDYLLRYDADMDFGADVLNIFLQDHCPGKILYWKAASFGVVPITRDGSHIIVPVILDGKEIRALIDTGADTSLKMEEASRLFDLKMGDADTPEDGVLNGDETLKMYRHTFKTLTIGDVTVTNPLVGIYPDAMGKNADHSTLVWSRAQSEASMIKAPDMIIGMNVLRKLHVYIAFGENKMYVTEASPAAGALQ